MMRIVKILVAAVFIVGFSIGGAPRSGAIDSFCSSAPRLTYVTRWFPTGYSYGTIQAGSVKVLRHWVNFDAGGEATDNFGSVSVPIGGGSNMWYIDVQKATFGSWGTQRLAWCT